MTEPVTSPAIESGAQPTSVGKGITAAGGIVGAILASACCIGPLVLLSLGIGGAWIGNLTAFAPYQPIFVVLTLGFLGWGFYLVYGRPKAPCAEGSYCAKPSSDRITKIALWIGTVVILFAIAFPYAAPYLFDF